MSSPARNAEKRKNWEVEREKRDAEHARVQSLSIYDRIQEHEGSDDLKEILLLIAEKAGVDVHEVP